MYLPLIFSLQIQTNLKNCEEQHPQQPEIKQEIPSPVGSYSSDPTPASSSCSFSTKANTTNPSIKIEPGVNDSSSVSRCAMVTTSEPIAIPKRETIMTSKQIKSEIGTYKYIDLVCVTEQHYFLISSPF